MRIRKGGPVHNRGMSVKEQVQTILNNLPPEATLEDVQYHLYVLQCLEQGRKAIAEGRTHTQTEVEQRLAKWLAR